MFADEGKLLPIVTRLSIDWQKIAKYAPEANEPEQPRNCQYEYDYPAQETQSGDHGIGL